MDDREKILTELGLNPVWAHEYVFGDTHRNVTTPEHRRIILKLHSDNEYELVMGFRGMAKSTLGEEAMTLQGAFARVKNVVILGENEERAVDRLKQIKHHFEYNDILINLFGIEPGETWHETKAILSNGVVYQAFGRAQSLRGVKHLDQRPDYVLMDDLEDLESVATPASRRKTFQWLTRTVIPALEPGGRVRMLATPLHPEALAPTLAKQPAWHAYVVPIIHKDGDDEWVATWPDRFSVAWALKRWEEMKALGQGEDFMQEYMCEAVDPASQTFTNDMIRVVPVERRRSEAVYAIYDPARTTHQKSATTGKVVVSWRGTKLIVWDAFAKRMTPSEIVEDMFNVEREYSPVAIGFEETGLNEWALQPIRSAQVQRGVTLPLRPLHAPKGKLDFIRGLQPFFAAHEVDFARDLPDLRDQLLGFPSGHIDAPNALAYALRLRVGLPIVENFSDAHIVDELKITPRKPLYLCVNTDGRVVTAVLCQLDSGRLKVFADWLVEGDPGQTLRDIVAEANLDVPSGGSPLGKSGASRVSLPGGVPRLLIPRPHYDRIASVGLLQTAKRIGESVRGGDILAGREELRGLTSRQVHGLPGLAVASDATWTVRALSGGFARPLDSHEPAENPYRVLMEGLEAFAGLLRTEAVAGDNNPNYAYTSDGRRYVSALSR